MESEEHSNVNCDPKQSCPVYIFDVSAPSVIEEEGNIHDAQKPYFWRGTYAVHDSVAHWLDLLDFLLSMILVVWLTLPRGDAKDT